jgi:hypothetical protein
MDHSFSKIRAPQLASAPAYPVAGPRSAGKPLRHVAVLAQIATTKG